MVSLIDRASEIRRFALGPLLAVCVATTASACNTEALYDMVFGDPLAGDEQPVVWEVPGLVAGGTTFVVETRPGARVTAPVESNDNPSRADFEVEATADDDGKATLEIVPDEPEKDESFTARIRVEGDDDGQMVHPRFTPEPLTSARLTPVDGASGSKGDELTLHIACEDAFIIHPKAHVAATNDGHIMRLFVPHAETMTLAGKPYSFEPATLSFEAKNQDFDKKTMDLPVPATTITVAPGGFASAIRAKDLGEPTIDAGPRFEITLDDDTKCHGSIGRPIASGFDLPAVLAKPKARASAGDDEGWDGELVALRSHDKGGEKMSITAYGDRKAPRQALRYVMKEEDKIRTGSPCKYENTSTGGKESVDRQARDRVVTIYDRTTGEVAKTITVSAPMPGCAVETYGTEHFENAASDEKVDQQIEKWAKKAL